MSIKNVTIAPLGMAFILVIGLMAIGLFLLGVHETIARTWNTQGRYHEQVLIRNDGKPFIATYQGSNYTDPTYRSLDNQPLEAISYGQHMGVATLANSTEEKPSLWPIPWSQRIRAFSNAYDSGKSWYFVHDGKVNGRGWFVGYYTHEKRLIGYIGTDGFSPVPLPWEKHFACDGRRFGYAGGVIANRFALGRSSTSRPAGAGWPVFLISGHKLLEIDLENRSVNTILESDDLVSVNLAPVAMSAEEWLERPSSSNLSYVIALRHRDRIEMIDPQQGVLASFAIPVSMRDKELSVYFADNRTAVVQHWNYQSSNGSTCQLHWLASDGTESRLEELTLGSMGSVEDSRIALVQILLTGGPLLSTAIYTVHLPSTLMRSGEASSFADALGQILAKSWPELLFTYAVSALLAWLAYRRHRRYGLPRAWVWVVFVAVLGLPGMLAYLFHRTWPPIVPCPACEKPAARNRPDCSSCGEQFPSPTRKGIEVFA